MLSRIEQRSFSNVMAASFDKVYYADGTDIHAAMQPDGNADILTRVSAFLGLPNRILDKNKRQSLTNLFDNFIGYQENTTPQRKNINYFLMPLIILLNSIRVSIKFTLNIFKLATELLPVALSNLVGYSIFKLIEHVKSSSAKTSTRWLAGIGVFLCFFA